VCVCGVYVCVCLGRCVECRSDTLGSTEVNCVSVCVYLGRCDECRSYTVGGTEVNCASECVCVCVCVWGYVLSVIQTQWLALR